jgi:hypothetical protein
VEALRRAGKKSVSVGGKAAGSGNGAGSGARVIADWGGKESCASSRARGCRVRVEMAGHGGSLGIGEGEWWRWTEASGLGLGVGLSATASTGTQRTRKPKGPVVMPENGPHCRPVRSLDRLSGTSKKKYAVLPFPEKVEHQLRFP